MVYSTTKSTVCSVLILSFSFVLFPYIGVIISDVTCRLKPTTGTDSTKLRLWNGITLSHTDFSEIEPVSDLNVSVPEILEDQQRRIGSFCSKGGCNTTVYDDKILTDLYHHLLVDDSRKILFCYIPKVACSNWKRVFLILGGLVDPCEKLRPSVEVFRKVRSLDEYSPSEQEYRLRHYFKFMFVRNPLERIVSAYRNKIEHPINNNQSEQTIWDETRSLILQYYRSMKDEAYRSDLPYPTFSEFIHFLSDSSPADMNEHYKPMSDLCQPCAVHYHYIGNFATLRRDANRILQYLNVNTSWFWDRGRHFTNPTQNVVGKYFSMLEAEDVKLVEDKFFEDLLFYRYLFSSATATAYN